MAKRMFIDASHPEETRVVVLDGNKVEEFDFEAAARRPLKGNIYLAKVTRVEPSLQAAFVEYGGNRQGFLAFAEIHPDYYQIPVADRQALIAAQSARRMADDDDVESFDTSASAAAKAKLEDEEHGDHGDDEHHEDAPEARHHDDEHHEDEDSHSEDGHSDDRHDDHDEDHHEDAHLEDEHHDDQEPVHAEAHEDDHAEDDHEHEHADGDEGATAESEPGENDAPRAEILTESTGTPVAARRSEPRRQREKRPRIRAYKIQEVIKRRQIMLVQVVKEERGNKGAALTTFLSLAGRYCVLMPNTPRGGGISRKITSATDRRRLKSAAQSLELPEGMGLIIRTAGANRTKVEIKRDYEYLLRLWDSVRELTLKSNAPALVYEEGNLIKRVIRDLYNKDIEDIVVDGDEGYREAKEFMRMLMPSHAKNVKPYKEPLPLFQHHHVDAQLDAMFSPTVILRSGGYIVINQTEALVSIDVNSGKATREHNIEDTATKTNLEAADEIGRQLRLRDLAGLIVIDFIDMEDGKNDRNVEKRLRDAVRGDRARIQIGKISQFGLMEMSRQRLRAGVIAGSTVTCPHCAGQGIIRSTESAALRLLRALDEQGHEKQSVDLLVKAPADVTIYTLNQKRRELARIEEVYDLVVTFDPRPGMPGGTFEIERVGVRVPTARPKSLAVSPEDGLKDRPEEDVTLVEAPEDDMISEDLDEEEEDIENEDESSSESRERNDADSEPRGENRGNASAEGIGEAGRKRRRRRRGGRNRNGRADGPRPENGQQSVEQQQRPAQNGEDHAEHSAAPGAAAEGGVMGEDGVRRRRRRRRGRHRRREGGEGMEGQSPNHAQSDAPASDTQTHMPAFTAEDSTPVAPNAPSTPQWSLAAEAAPVQESWSRPSPAVAETPTAHVQHIPREPVPSGASESASDEPSDENRKGWWKRRFKIGE